MISYILHGRLNNHLRLSNIILINKLYFFLVLGIGGPERIEPDTSTLVINGELRVTERSALPYVVVAALSRHVPTEMDE